MFCLESGIVCVESLGHVVFECPSYQHLRCGDIAKPLADGDVNVFIHHRDVWEWNILKQLRAFYLNVTDHRRGLAQLLGGRESEALQARAEANWL